jgi:CRP-like cAMP-binding protein
MTTLNPVVVRMREEMQVFQHPPFDLLTDSEKALLYRHSRITKLKKHEFLFVPDDHKLYEYLLLEGVIKEYTLSSRRTIIRQVIHPNEYFYPISYHQGPTHDSFATAMSKNATVLCLKEDCIESIVSQNSLFSARYIDLIKSRSKHYQARIESLMRDDAKTRIVNFLYSNATKFGVKIGMDEVLLKHSYTQQDIADYTGTSRQTIVTILNELKEQNTITLMRHKLLIRDMSALANA